MTFIETDEPPEWRGSAESRAALAKVRNQFLQMKRVQEIANLDPLEFLQDYEDTILAYADPEIGGSTENALMVLGDSFEIESAWASAPAVMSALGHRLWRPAHHRHGGHHSGSRASKPTRRLDGSDLPP